MARSNFTRRPPVTPPAADRHHGTPSHRSPTQGGYARPDLPLPARGDARRRAVVAVGQHRDVVPIDRRAEQIAAALVPPLLGAEAVAQADGAPMDYVLVWPDGREGVLEVTLVADPEAIKWQNQLAEAGGAWLTTGKWELRLRTLAMQYRPTETAARRVVDLCRLHGTTSPAALPPDIRAEEDAVARIESVGELRRVKVGREGISVFVPIRAEFVEATDGDFASLLERWVSLQHVAAHVAKTSNATSRERHLFLVPLDDVLPVRFYTDDFRPPSRFPRGYEGIDGLWVWSNYWHRFLGWRGGRWSWEDFPSRTSDSTRSTQ